MKLCPAIIASLLFAAPRAFSQSSFANLNFESAVTISIPGDPYNRVQFGPALAGWTGYVGTNVQTRALYNNIFLDSTGLGIHGIASPMRPIGGNYSAFIQAKFGLTVDGYPPGTLVEASLSQMGLVPLNAQSLLFRGRGGNFQVGLGGVTLSLIPLLSTSLYSFWSGHHYVRRKR